MVKFCLIISRPCASPVRLAVLILLLALPLTLADEDAGEGGNDGDVSQKLPASGNRKPAKEGKGDKEDKDKDKDKKVLTLMFNKEMRTPGETGYLNQSDVEEMCAAAKPCYSSDEVVPLCGSDSNSYLNPGVFVCAQKCKEGLNPLHFGPCPEHVMPPTTSTTPKTTTPTTPKHVTNSNRVRVLGFLKKFFKWLGMHVHEDGGFYLADEKENDEAWWNV